MSKPDYKGFVLDVEERTARGFPIDMSLLRELAEKYGTPDLTRCDHSDSAFSLWEEDPDYMVCRYCGAMKITR